MLMWGQNTNHDLDAIGLALEASTETPTSVPLPQGAPVVAVELEFYILQRGPDGRPQPARGLLTGRNPTRVGIYSYLPENHVMHLRAEEITVAELAAEKTTGTRPMP